MPQHAPAQKKQLIADLEKMPGTTKSIFAGCIFWPHHTIQFHKNKKNISTMRLCYKCDDTIWSATKLTPPADLQPTIAKTLRRLKMNPNRDWVKLVSKPD